MEFYQVASILFFCALLAGFIDSIAGGGGVIALSGLLIVGIDPLSALATNKLQGVFSTLLSGSIMFKHRLVTIGEIAVPFLMSLIGSALGAGILLMTDVRYLEWIVPALLLFVAIFLAAKPKFGHSEQKPKLSNKAYNVTAPTAIGLYDGYFGPGAGTFFALAECGLLGHKIVRATARAKFMNFASNLGAVLIFTSYGPILYAIAPYMIAGQLIGSYLGAKTVIKEGERVIRPAMLVILILIITKFVWDQI